MEKEIDLHVDLILKTYTFWPPWFKLDINGRISREVQRNMTSNYDTSVRVGVEEKKREEWQPYLEKYMWDSIIPYLQKISITKFIQEISHRSFQLNCQICGTINTLKITSKGMADLFQGITLTIPCQNPQCKDEHLQSNFSFSLATLLIFLTEPPTMPI